jgi:hypothetical protein
MEFSLLTRTIGINIHFAREPFDLREDEMHDYFTSYSLSRRDFLKGMALAAAGLLLPSASRWPEGQALAPVFPFWWCGLRDGKPHGSAHPGHCFGLPGSLMKLVAATALLEERLLSPDELLECRGTLRIQGQLYRCQHAHGKISMRQALAFSCNIYFAQAAEVLSTRRFLQYAQAFQLDRPTGSSKESAYLFPSQTALTQASQLYVLGLAKSMQPNAAQLLRMTRHIALRDIHGFQPATWRFLQSGMRSAVTQGTARQLDPQNRLRVAAKTGTTPSGELYQSWVMGFFPIEKPVVAFCGRALSGTAKDAAVPAARQRLQKAPWATV